MNDLTYWHELDADAPADPERPCPDDCLVCEHLSKDLRAAERGTS